MYSSGSQSQNARENKSDALLWEHHPGSPSPALANCVYAYGGYHETPGRPVRRLEVPRDRVMLILGWGNSLRLRPAATQLSPSQYTAFVVGFDDQPLIAEYSGTQTCIEVELPPWTISQLSGCATTEFTQGPIHLQDIWGHEAQLLIEQLSDRPTWQARFALVDRVLVQKLSEFHAMISPEIQWAWQQLDQYGGCLAIRQLAKTIGWSDRYFATRFRTQIGITPKAAARRIRFNRALRLLETPNGLALSAIAATCGYSDQSHLTREFRSFSGCSPRAYRRARFTDLPGIPSHIIDA